VASRLLRPARRRPHGGTVVEAEPVAAASALDSLALLAQAVERACAAVDPGFRRVNVEILGNTDPYLQAHVWPRYDWEPAHLVQRPVWLYPAGRWQDPDTALGAQHEHLRSAINAHLAAGRDDPRPGVAARSGSLPKRSR